MSRNPFLAHQWPVGIYRGGELLLTQAYSGEPLEIGKLFGRQAPVLLEIGPGRGFFLLETAEKRPDWNILALEITQKRAAKLSGKARRRELENVVVINGSARDVLEGPLLGSTFSEIHIHFPDPWPKKRHHKRRLVQPGFLPFLIGALEPQALVCAMTDHPDYGQQMLEVLDSDTRLQNLAGESCFSSLPDEAPTYYLGEKLASGHTIYVVRLRRRTLPRLLERDSGE